MAQSAFCRVAAAGGSRVFAMPMGAQRQQCVLQLVLLGLHATAAATPPSSTPWSTPPIDKQMPVKAPTAAANAGKFSLHNLFSDSMVLQADAPTFFGTCTTGSTVTVWLSEENKQGAECGGAGSESGRWKVVFPASPASDPTKPGLAVRAESSGGGGTVTLNDVLLGDVWV